MSFRGTFMHTWIQIELFFDIFNGTLGYPSNIQLHMLIAHQSKGMKKKKSGIFRYSIKMRIFNQIVC